ncbi:hypothetical protein SEA_PHILLYPHILLY_107 [Microbacterium phage PhillyPhilly]|nr:hypothetical protein SEA_PHILLYPHILLY_107 [Microbacterium phage PhillyPhilly]
MTSFKIGDRVTHKLGAIKGEAVVVFTPDQIGYSDTDQYGIRYEAWDYEGKDYPRSPDRKDFHTAVSGNLTLVARAEPKAHTTTRIATRNRWAGEDRIVNVTSGTKALSLSVIPNPSLFGHEHRGSTNLTPEQAEQLANDILDRVAEIRAGQNEEAGE